MGTGEFTLKPGAKNSWVGEFGDGIAEFKPTGKGTMQGYFGVASAYIATFDGKSATGWIARTVKVVPKYSTMINVDFDLGNSRKLVGRFAPQMNGTIGDPALGVAMVLFATTKNPFGHG